MSSVFISCGLAGLALCVSGAACAEQIAVESTEVRISDMGPAVLLRVGNRAIPVFVDPIVAQSIQGALSGQKPVRPLSHDLMHSVLTGFGGRVSQVVITLHEGIYYGALTVVMDGKTKLFDSRSSDAIALAIHARAPILVSRELLDQVGVELEARK
ncbi:MAG TPA: bifunctional nuclease family protein [Burkholderiales bacterium]|nr:bifunctional nuclease family protein [Burkholderiales bacterium]